MKKRVKILTISTITLMLIAIFAVISINSPAVAHPLNEKDMQVDFVVYPNGTIGVDGTFNFTNMYPPNMGPLMNTTLSISTVGETTTGAASGSVIVPEDGMLGWPFNSTTANFALQYGNGLLDAALDATVFMPRDGTIIIPPIIYPINSSDFSFNSTYSNGLLDVELWGKTRLPSYYNSMFPFNVTDFIVLADYMENDIKGNITFRALSGLPLSDVVVYLRGNKTDLHLTGNLTVIYGNYFDFYIDSAILDEMLANFTRDMPGPTGLVSNMTDGLLECTQWNTTKTPLTNSVEYGALVDYNVTIHGNFVGFLAKLLAMYSDSPETEPILSAALESALSSVKSASLTLNYYYTPGMATLDLRLASDVKALWSKALELVPPTVPIENRTMAEAWLKIANATAYAIQGFSLNASYSGTAQKLDLDAWLSANTTQLEDDIIPFLPDAVPPQLRDIVESYVSTIYCELTSSSITLTYLNGTADFDMDWVLQGDFKAEMNHLKRFYIDYLNATTPMALTWQYLMLNMTEININKLEAEFRIGKDWMYITFNGLIAEPSKDVIDFIRFKLYRFLNMTSHDPMEPPRQFEKLKITIKGGANATHTILLYAVPTVSRPDEVSLDYKVMTWQNTSLSSLKDLLFQIAYQAIIDYLEKTYYVPIFTNSTVSNFNFNPDAKSISFNVTGTTGTGFCNATIPKSLLRAALGEWTIRIDGITLTPGNFTVVENAEYAFIYLNYSHSDHKIEIVGTWVVTEFPPYMLPPILMILSLIALIIAVKQRKRLNTLKTRYQTAIHTFINKLYPQKT